MKSRKLVICVPAAPQGFHADGRASYRKEAGEDARARMQAWFKKYGVLS